MPLNRPLQVSRTVTRVGAFLQQELLHTGSAIEYKLVGARGHQHALLHHAEFDIKNLSQVLVPKSLEHHRLVDAVHELGRELAPSSFDCSALNLVVEAIVDL